MTVEEGPAYERYQALANAQTLSFPDVTLIPQRNSLTSRSHVDLGTEFVAGLPMHLPFVAANMDTVVGEKMAIAIATYGGIAVLPRFNTVEQQMNTLDEVKRARRIVIEQPFTLSNTLSISEVRELLDKEDVGGALVRDQNGEIIGLVSMRDVILANGEEIFNPVSSVMTPRKDLIVAPVGISIPDARKIMHKYRKEKLPLVDENGKIVAMITTRGILEPEKNPHATVDQNGRLAVAVAVGVQPKDIERASEAVRHGADAIVIDIAHGHSQQVIDMAIAIKKEHPQAKVIAGNIVTFRASEDLINEGAVDGVKVGVGPGAHCTTRETTGHGEGQISAIMLVANSARKKGIALIADGGVQHSGDIVKALAAGATSIMMGSMLMGAEESPAQMVTARSGIIFKMGRGMSSRDASQDQDKISKRLRREIPTPEGIRAPVPFTGPVEITLDKLRGGVKSGLTYSGSKTIFEIHMKAEFKKVGEGFAEESAPRAGQFGGFG